MRKIPSSCLIICDARVVGISWATTNNSFARKACCSVRGTCLLSCHMTSHTRDFTDATRAGGGGDRGVNWPTPELLTGVRFGLKGARSGINCLFFCLGAHLLQCNTSRQLSAQAINTVEHEGGQLYSTVGARTPYSLTNFHANIANPHDEFLTLTNLTNFTRRELFSK